LFSLGTFRFRNSFPLSKENFLSSFPSPNSFNFSSDSIFFFFPLSEWIKPPFPPFLFRFVTLIDGSVLPSKADPLPLPSLFFLKTLSLHREELFFRSIVLWPRGSPFFLHREKEFSLFSNLEVPRTHRQAIMHPLLHPPCATFPLGETLFFPIS